MNKTLLLLLALCSALVASAQKPVPEKPRILISTDIGGTDPDDNQSMMHFLLYSNEFDCEGLVSSPSYGDGTKKEILRMIDLYEKDLPRLKAHAQGWPTPKYLRSIAKQGRHGASPMVGYSEPTEGSEWIVKCAKRKSKRPLYLLVWGGLDDVAQALHDCPSIKNNIRVYWIGGPNKKWSLNSYVYIVENFPDLWFIEDNASYRGFIADYKNPDKHNAGFYDFYVKGAGNLGEDFYNYKNGLPKLGDTPALLYMMDGDPTDPTRESWGGSYVKGAYSSRVVLHRTATARDTIQRDGIIEFHIKGPVRKAMPINRPCIVLTVDKQKWNGYYLGNGDYMVRYSTYKTGTMDYTITAEIDGFPTQKGSFTVDNVYPGRHRATDYVVGDNWYVDRADASLYWSGCQGAQTVFKWRDAVMEDWGRRCQWLKD